VEIQAIENPQDVLPRIGFLDGICIQANLANLDLLWAQQLHETADVILVSVRHKYGLDTVNSLQIQILQKMAACSGVDDRDSARVLQDGTITVADVQDRQFARG
jgi:hypothetical protein